MSKMLTELVFLCGAKIMLAMVGQNLNMKTIVILPMIVMTRFWSGKLI